MIAKHEALGNLPGHTAALAFQTCMTLFFQGSEDPPSSTVVDTEKGHEGAWALAQLVGRRGSRCDYALVRGSIWKKRGGSGTPMAWNRRVDRS
jgi:hypothetical protein